MRNSAITSPLLTVWRLTVWRRYDRNRELGPDSNLETRFDLSTLGNAQADGRTLADYVVTKRLSIATRQFFDKRKCRMHLNRLSQTPTDEHRSHKRHERE
jgi:hypothetical protein